MKILWSALFVATFACLTANAHTKIYEFDLSGAAESPPVATPGTGFARATFDLDLVTMRIEASFSGLLGNTTLAHIHCCDFQANTNAGVATMTPSFTGFPSGVTAGTYDHTFDMTLASSYRAQFLAANGDSVANALSSLIAGLDSGQAYFNVHTSLFGGGEIRGQAVLVPEPASAILAVGALAMPLLLRHRRSR
jgi:hypothetical protein